METKMQTEMDKVTATAVERVGLARQELILERTFYGVLVSQVVPVPSRQVPTMATDGKRHFFNPEFVATLSHDELLGVQAHEKEHDARRHHTRRDGRDPKEWNVCTDFAINIDLIDAGFVLPKGALVDPKYRGMSAEDIFRCRELDRQKQQPQPQPQKNDDDAQGDGEAGDEAGDDEGQGAGEAGKGAGDDVGSDGTGNGADKAGEARRGGVERGEVCPGEALHGEAEGDGESEQSGSPDPSADPGRCGQVLDAADDAAELADEEARWERTLRQAASLSKARGNQPGHVSREVARSDHPPQDWRETLRAFFDGGAISKETWSRPNRRFIGSGLYLPGREREGINRAAILVDTSGSMDKIALECIRVETQAALDEGVIDELVIVYGDTRVTRVDEYRAGDEIDFDPRGGGGTELMPLFKHVADEVDASLIVCFTDGYIDITSAHPEPACPVLWAYTGYPYAVKQMIENAPWGAAAIDVGSH
jgi:predicted metal-dependent peptidase